MIATSTSISGQRCPMCGHDFMPTNNPNIITAEPRPPEIGAVIPNPPRPRSIPKERRGQKAKRKRKKR